MNKMETHNSNGTKKKYKADFLRKCFSKNEIGNRSQNFNIIYVYILIAAFLLLLDKIVSALFDLSSLPIDIYIITVFIFVAITCIINFTLINKCISVKDKMEASNILLSAILESSPEIMAFSLDTNYCYTTFNNMHKEAMLSIWGKKIEIGMNILDVIEYEENHQKAKENFDRVLNGESFSIGEEYGDDKLARLYWQNYYSPILNNGKVIGLTCFVLNITALKKAEENNRILSYNDQLTDLYNRRFFEESLNKMDTENNYPISIIMADVNGLKFTNDIFGHVSGDRLIKSFAEVLRKELRKEDIVARIGGDEFAILIPKTDSLKLERIIKRIKQSISNYKLDKSILSVSLGGSTKYTSDQSFEQLIKDADDAMYNQKLVDRNIFKSNLFKYLYFKLYDENLIEKSHAKEVSEFCRKLGIELDFSSSQVSLLESAGLLHDIGKIVIHKEILLKQNKLNQNEFKEIKRHCEIGYKILNYFKRYTNISEYVLYHHERIDGHGYPEGLKGSEIPIFSRIISIADAYNSMTSDNGYKNKLSKQDAIKELKINAGTQFDADITKVFVEKVLGEKWN